MPFIENMLGQRSWTNKSFRSFPLLFLIVLVHVPFTYSYSLPIIKTFVGPCVFAASKFNRFLWKFVFRIRKCLYISAQKFSVYCGLRIKSISMKFCIWNSEMFMHQARVLFFFHFPLEIFPYQHFYEYWRISIGNEKSKTHACGRNILKF